MNIRERADIEVLLIAKKIDDYRKTYRVSEEEVFRRVKKIFLKWKFNSASTNKEQTCLQCFEQLPYTLPDRLRAD